MNSLFGRAALLAGACVLASCGLVWAGAVAADETPDAAAIFKTRCALCHGPNGDSKVPGMAFVNRQWKHGTSLKEIQTTIRNGVPGTAMLPFKAKLKDAEIEALARHVRSFDRRLKPEESK
jgi:mono/diheme cytochrome c family protein